MKEVNKPHEAEIGDTVSMGALLAYLGKFYTIEGVSYCDMPTMTFKMVDTKSFAARLSGGARYERIE